MRLYPVVWILDFQAIKDCEMGGYRVPTDCSVFMSQWVMHRSERYFEQPLVFNPDRWAGDFEKKSPPGGFFTFWGWPGQLLWRRVLLLATIAQKFEMTLVPGQSIVPQPTITLQPSNGVKVVLKQR